MISSGTLIVTLLSLVTTIVMALIQNKEIDRPTRGFGLFPNQSEPTAFEAVYVPEESAATGSAKCRGLPR